MMPFKKVVLLTLCLLGIAIAPNAAYADQGMSPTDVVEKFCEKLSDVDAASKYIISKMNFGDTQTDSQIKNQSIEFRGVLERIGVLYGNYLSCDFGNKMMVGDVLLRLDYVVMYEVHPMVLQVHFAKRDGEWRVYNLDIFDDKDRFPYQEK